MKLKTFKKLIEPLPDNAEITIGEAYGDEIYHVKAIVEDSEDTGYNGYHNITVIPMPHSLDEDDLTDMQVYGDRVIYNTEDSFDATDYQNKKIRIQLTRKGEVKRSNH